MEALLRIFENQSSLTGISQIALDILILALLAVVLFAKRRRISRKDGEVIESFQKIIEETGAISRNFETNLQQRQNLIQQVTAGLDQRILDAQKMCEKLKQSMDQLVQLNADTETKSSSSAIVQVRNSNQQKVILLAKKGLDASEIAKKLNKPLGEVELILNLQKISM
jgi:DNA-directed RNA polymerase specialized sigma24 family protein